MSNIEERARGWLETPDHYKFMAESNNLIAALLDRIAELERIIEERGPLIVPPGYEVVPQSLRQNMLAMDKRIIELERLLSDKSGKGE